MERGRVKKPVTGGSGSQFYVGADFYVSASVECNKHKFVLLEADEYAYNYMESHPDEVSKTCGITGRVIQMRYSAVVSMTKRPAYKYQLISTIDTSIE